ncbi:MAG: general secretion pathway protein GspB [Gammaproteobacteria bacterium]
MSLILDALRKSERTRQQNLSGRVSAADAPPVRARIPVPWATLVGMLLVVNVVALAIIFWNSRDQRSAPVPMAAVPAPAPAVPAPDYRPAVRSLAAEAAATSNAPAPMAANPATALAAASVATPPARANPAPASAQSANSSGSSSTDLSANTPPPLDTLPLAFQQSLPPLHLDVHGYAAKPADRFVVINMQRYQAGDTLQQGPKVVRIVPNGVVLEYHGQEFLLPRP